MTGYVDELTGQMVMAGSPDTVCLLDLDFDQLLGKSGHPIIGLKLLKERAIKQEQQDYLERADAAEKLVIAAQRLFTAPFGKLTDLETAKTVTKLFSNLD